jgi:hypothetical protein
MQQPFTGVSKAHLYEAQVKNDQDKYARRTSYKFHPKF